MKKKTFYQTSIFWQVICFVFLAAFVLCSVIWVRVAIDFVESFSDISSNEMIVSAIKLIVSFIAILMVLRVFIRFEHNNIHFTEEKIYINDDWNNERNKIQYYSEVKFVEIEAVDIIWTANNSQGKPIKSHLIASAVKKPYLSIKTKSGEVANFFVMYFSKKSMLKIIDEIRVRMNSVGNYTAIIQEEEAVQKMDRKPAKKSAGNREN